MQLLKYRSGNYSPESMLGQVDPSTPDDGIFAASVMHVALHLTSPLNLRHLSCHAHVHTGTLLCCHSV